VKAGIDRNTGNAKRTGNADVIVRTLPDEKQKKDKKADKMNTE
jgi:hypothetical protein